jgi:hypothetical protein
MFEIYAAAIIWDGLGKISSYAFLLMIPYDGNGSDTDAKKTEL